MWSVRRPGAGIARECLIVRNLQHRSPVQETGRTHGTQSAEVLWRSYVVYSLKRVIPSWKRAIALACSLGLGLFVITTAREVFRGQRADYGWDPAVARPAFSSEHPRVVIDQAHSNASTAGFTGRYWPLARLLRADGCRVRKGTDPFSLQRLNGIDVLVIANARGAPKPQIFGVNLPVRTSKKSDDPAFTPEEIQAVRTWVEHGGALLLIADHAPMGAASEALAAAFGVKMHKGFVEVPGELSDPLLFSKDNGRLGDHPILAGDGPGTEVRRVMTFTGQSLDGPPGATALLRLPDSAIEYIPAQPEFRQERAGATQGLAFEQGRGRVVVLGEAAMLTAQVYKGVPFGMNSPGNDNRQFALNVIHWLLRRL